MSNVFNHGRLPISSPCQIPNAYHRHRQSVLREEVNTVEIAPERKPEPVDRGSD
uniref:Uncharacterized protein n=1 Tax=Rhizophora mucronata TaxID=61149 RepID=A0A2P2N8E0_RHIMU